MDSGFTDRKWRNKGIRTGRGVCSGLFPGKTTNGNSQRGDKKAHALEIFRELLHLKEVWVCRRCQLIVPLWQANVNLRWFVVCPSLLKNASHTIDKCKHWRSCSPSLFNSDFHLQENQAENHELGNAVHMQRDITLLGLWAESCNSRSQVPTSITSHSYHATHTAAAYSHFKDQSDFLKEIGSSCTHVPDVRPIHESLKVDQDNSHICPQDSSKIIYIVFSLATDFMCWLGKSVSIGKVVNLTHPLLTFVYFFFNQATKFPRYKI